MQGWEQRLLRWFGRHRRAMPWRDSPEPYAVWISEIMLQQTQVETVMPYFKRFVEKFPDVRRLAAAKEDDVLKAWEGLGYYSRARNLQKAARRIVDVFDGCVPATVEDLRSLPGVGAYTAAAVASIAFGVPVPCVDGNVLRVMARFRGSRADIAQEATKRETAEFLEAHISRRSPGNFNQALMELGAMVCRPRHPDCKACPLASDCRALARGITGRLPVKSRKGDVPQRFMVAGVVRWGQRILIGKRVSDGMLAGLWDLPGGAVTAKRNLQAAVKRDVTIETGVECEVQQGLGTVDHAYSHFKVTLHVFDCKRAGGRLTPGGRFTQLRWVTAEQLDAYPLTGLARKVLR